MQTLTSSPALSRALAAVGFWGQWRQAGTSGGLGRLFQILILWQDRESQRRALEALDDRLLADVGLGRDHAAREAAKPFWRP